MMFGKSREYPLGKNFGGRPKGPQQVLLLQRLAAEQQHRVIEPCSMELLDCARVERIAQVEPADFRADVLRKTDDVEGSLGCDNHGTSS